MIKRLLDLLRRYNRWYSKLALDIEDAKYGIVRDEDGTPHFR